MQHSSDTKRIAKNTAFLYIRSILVMVVSIYTSRVILQQLGVDDYGIYNVVGGVVGMFSMFSATFVSASQRFLSYSLGSGNLNGTREIFSISVQIHVILAIFLFFLIEIIGGWYLGKYMNIPDGRLDAAYIVFHISNLSFVINLLSIPYNALIIAKENMDVFAYVSIFEVLARLCIVLILPYLNADKLVLYSILLLLVSLIVRLFYGFYCGRKFPESKVVKIKNKGLYKNFLAFSGWNFLGSGTTILNVNGTNLILNYFCGVAINTSKGLTTQVQSAVMQLVSNFLTAMNPQIVKSYSVGDKAYVNSLISSGSKLGFYLLLFISLPIVFTASDVLSIWLGEVPPYTTIFLILVLVTGLLNPFTTLLDTLLSASGHIKNYQIETSITTLISLPILCYVLYLGAEPYAVYVIGFILGIVNLCIRIYNCSKYVNGFNTSFYLLNVVLKTLVVPALAIIVPLLFRLYFYNGSFLFWIIQCVIVEFSLLFSILVIGLTSYEKNKLKEMIVDTKNKWLKL